MKKIGLSLATCVVTTFLFGQQQISNSDFELWDNLGASNEEPSNWNSFKTGQGSFASFASQQVQRSTAIRSGATGQYCVRVWSKSTLGIVANGNLTLGRINMGSSTASDPANYNFSQTADANFSEALTTSPDSLVFWVKFTPASGNPNARVHAVLHDAYDLRDPIDANSTSHVISRAELNYPSTGGQWVRKSVPFVFQGPATSQQFILITFTTNQTPGGGAANDEILIDDIELVYNQSIVNQQITANDDASFTDQNTPVVIDVLANDIDPENNILLSTVTIIQQGQNGTATSNIDGTVTYTPNLDFYGVDNFNYEVCDGDIPTTCDQANVTLVINPTNGLSENDAQITISYHNGIIIGNLNGMFKVYNSNGSLSKEFNALNAKNMRLENGIYFIYSNELNRTFKIFVN